MSTDTAVTPTCGQASALRALATGKACPADVASVLERIADGRYVTGHDVFYVTRGREGARNLLARLRAVGLDIMPGSGGTPPHEASAIELTEVRASLRAVALGLADAMDRAALSVAAADHAYGKELGWH